MAKTFILRHILAAIFLTGSIVSAQLPPEGGGETVEAPKLVSATVVVKADAKNPEAVVGRVDVEPTPQPDNTLDVLRGELATFQKAADARKNNALNILGDEARRLQEREQEKHEKDGFFLTTNKKFAPESMTFFVAMGLVTFNSMWIKSHGDPLALERHILSLKDPIAHISFYSFMVANGFYIDLKTHGLDPATKAQMMHRLSYQGMAIGSLASSLVADLGRSGKMCVDYWIMGRNDAQSVEACNGAWKGWTARNKFQQYFPQIIAMWASQAVTEVVDATTRKGFQKVSLLSAAKNLLTKETVVSAAKKITGVDVAMTLTGGTWTMKSIRWVGKLTQIMMFVGVDHAMSPYTYRPLNNLIRPLMFDFDALAINNFWTAADRIDWDDKRIPEANKIVCSARNPNCLEAKLIGEIESFGDQMQQWREHLNSDAEQDLVGWMELTKKLLNQVSYSYKFYKGFVGTFFETLNIGTRIRSKELEPSAEKNISGFPLRQLPLYGVGIGEYKTTGASVEDLYIIGTAELERKQIEFVQTVSKKAEKYKENLDAVAADKLTLLLAQFNSGDAGQIGAALSEINQILGVNSLKNNPIKTAPYSENFIKLLQALRQKLGNPMPVMYPFAGYSQAFATNTTYGSIVPEADFSLWSASKKYFFNKEADLMTYKIFCGNQTASLDKTTRFLGIDTGTDLLSPQFDPPTLLKSSKELTEFCGNWRKTRELKVFDENLYGQKIGAKSMDEFFIQNFNYAITGDYAKKENAENFDKWWMQNGRKTIDAEFKVYDQKFKELVEITHQNIFDQRSYANWFVDHLNQSEYLPTSLKASLQFEANFYLQVIARALDKSINAKSTEFNLKKVVANSKEEAFKMVSGQKTLPEVQKVQDLLNSYYLFILPEKVNFDQYIAHSKKIDAAINDLLVLAGLKSKGTAEEELAPLDLSAEETKALNATPSATGTENSPANYSDIQNVNPNLRQKAITAAVKGLRGVESEIRRFIRMKISLSQSLEIDTKEFQDDLKNTNARKGMSGAVKADPRGEIFLILVDYLWKT